MKLKLLNRTTTAIVTMLVLLMMSVGLAYAQEPSYGSGITVDGDSSDWNLANDFFADMYEAGRDSKEVLSKVYMRYDCSSEVLYLLVVLEDGHELNSSDGDQWVKLTSQGNGTVVDGSSGNNGTPPDFQYLAGSDGNAPGWEASIPFTKNTSDSISVHAQVDTPGGDSGRTSATTPDDSASNRHIPIETICVDPTTGTIIIEKVTTNDDDTTEFTFNPTGFNNDESFTLVGGGDQSFEVEVGSGYSIEEVVPDGWSLDTATCDDGSLVENIDVSADETVTCTFTNSEDPDPTGKLEVVKELIPANDNGSFDMRIDTTAHVATGGDGTTTGEQTVSVGTHLVSETGDGSTNLNDYTTSISCKDNNGTGSEVTATPNGNNAWDVDVNEDDDIVCIITNERNGTINIVKEATPADDTVFSFNQTINNSGGFNLTDPSDDTETFSNVPAGDYNVTEVVPDGWSLDDVTCEGGDSTDITDGVTIHLDAGEEITCTFENSKEPELGSITVVKEVVEGSTTSEFDFEIDLGDSINGFVLTDGDEETFSDLASGDYVINETFPIGESDDWEALTAEDIVCTSDGDSTFEYLPFADEADTFGVNVSLAAGDDVTCTFENSKVPPKKISPVLECVAPIKGTDMYRAFFGYSNPNDGNVEIPIGPDNKFNRAPQDQGQPTIFEPGRTPFFPNANFSVDFDGNPLVWTLNGKTATASNNPAQQCNFYVELDKEWEGGDAPDSTIEDLIAASSETDEVSCDWDGSKLVCSADTLKVPVQVMGEMFVGAYDVSEDGLPENWAVKSGVGEDFPVPNDSCDGKFCSHTVVNEYTPPLKKISPVLECVAPIQDGGYRAFFGYNNPNDVSVEIPIGPGNKFNRNPQDQGQPTTFEPGRTPFFPNAHFSVDFDGSPLVWTLNGKTATASDNPAQRCVYHITLEKEWEGDDAPESTIEDLISATSGDNTASCDWNGSQLVCEYNSNHNDLHVPVTIVEDEFVGSYGVLEDGLPDGWVVKSGVGNFTLEDAVCDGKFCTHTVVNETDEPELGSIHVLKYSDLNGNGERDEGEAGLNDWEFTLSNEDNEYTETTMDHNNEPGYAWFEDVPVGTYQLCETLQDGWKNTAPAEAVEGCIEVEVTASDDGGSIEHALPTGNSGPGVYTDEHVNGSPDPTTGVNGVKWDLPDNFDNTGGNEDDMGEFSITFDAVYEPTDVTVAVKSGGPQGGQTGTNTITGPSCDLRDSTTELPSGAAVTVTTGNGDSFDIQFLGTTNGGTTWNYKVTEPGTGKSLSHWVLGFGECTGGEEPPTVEFGNQELGSITIKKLTDPTDSDQKFKFEGDLDINDLGHNESDTVSDLMAGDYDVTEVVPDGWELDAAYCETDAENYTGIDDGVTVHLPAGADITCIFENSQNEPEPGKIVAFKFHDLNKDGVQDDGEPFLKDWEFTLKQDDAEIASDTTDEKGMVMFGDLEPGTYELCETMQDGWTNSTPICQEVTIGGGTAVVSAGIPNIAEALAGARYRSFGNTGGNEVYLGIPDLGVGGNRAEKGLTWTDGTHMVTFSYDPVTDKLVATVDLNNDNSVDQTVTYPNFSTQLVNKGKQAGANQMNVMEILVAERDADSTVDFNEVMLNGQSLGDFGTDNVGIWGVTGFDFGQGFTLSGKVVISGPFSNSQEKSKVDIKIGTAPLMFGNYREPIPGKIVAVKFNDLNKDGVKDEGEPFLADWEFTLKQGETEIISDTTDANGMVMFADLEPGTYQVCETMQDGWANSTPICQEVTIGGGTAVVSAGVPNIAEALSGARYRSFGNTGGNEVYLGIPDLGVGSNRAEKGLTWTDGTHLVTFSYEPALDRLVATVDLNDDNSVDQTVIYPNFSTQLGNKGKQAGAGQMNVMEILVAERDADSTVDFNEVMLNGQPLGDFGTDNVNIWGVTGFDFGQGFTLSGKIVISGPFSNSQEKSKVDIKIGTAPLMFGNYEVPKGKITIIKTANPADTDEQFSFTGDLGDFSLGSNGSQEFEVEAGAYDVTEIEIPEFWTLLTVQCGDQFLPIIDSLDPLGRQVTIEVEAGEELTCTFHNERVNYEAPVEDGNSNKYYLPVVVR